MLTPDLARSPNMIGISLLTLISHGATRKFAQTTKASPRGRRTGAAPGSVQTDSMHSDRYCQIYLSRVKGHDMASEGNSNIYDCVYVPARLFEDPPR